jgi:hypothetical protein
LLSPKRGKLIFERLALVLVQGQMGDDGFDGVGYMEDSILLNQLGKDHMVSNNTTTSLEHHIVDKGSLVQSGQQTKTVSKYSLVPAVSWWAPEAPV